ncbi:MAG: AAA family ATPase [Bacteroidota bacterium]
MSPTLILLRGLPGAGKTSLAKVLCEEGKWPVYSVDDFFVDPLTGNYQFDYKTNHLAYSQCMNNTETAMLQGVKKIFIDNTLTLDWEIEAYFKLAKKFSYKIFVLTVENRHQGQNQHQISHEQLEKMADKYKVVLL